MSQEDLLKVDDLPPAKYNIGSDVRNSLIASGCIVNSKGGEFDPVPRRYLSGRIVVIKKFHHSE